jgi:hypothetical protein
MPQYLVAIHLPDDYDPSTESEATIRDISSLNKEMIAAGVRTFVGGLESAGKAKTLRAQPDGQVRITDGPFAEAKEHIGGFWVLETADQDEALATVLKVKQERGLDRVVWRPIAAGCAP